MPGNPPGAFDSPPPYQDAPSSSSKSKVQNPPPDQENNTVQLSIDHGPSDVPLLLTTITITSTTTFEDFQRQVKQRFVESPRSNFSSGSFIWTTWLWGGSGRSSETEDRESVDAFTWEAMRGRIMGLAKAGTLGWKGRPCKLETVFRPAYLGKVGRARNAQQLQRMLTLHEQSERSGLLLGRHVPAPSMKEDECVVM